MVRAKEGHMMRFILILLMVLVPSAASFAAETAWQDVAPDARLRLISDGATTDGNTLIALDLRMPEALNTYWRIPGETGIPTQIELRLDGKPVEDEILWPLPVRDTASGFVDNIYRGNLVLPVRVPARKGRLTAEIMMGICSDICVPVRAEFALDLDPAAPDPGNRIRINQALAEVPEPVDPAQSAVGDIAFDWQEGLLTLRFDPQVVDPSTLIAATPDQSVVFGAAGKGAAPDRAQMPLLGRTRPEALAGVDLTVAFRTARGPFEITQRLEP